jgi:hypothetical protein
LIRFLEIWQNNRFDSDQQMWNEINRWYYGRFEQQVTAQGLEERQVLVSGTPKGFVQARSMEWSSTLACLVAKFIGSALSPGAGSGIGFSLSDWPRSTERFLWKISICAAWPKHLPATGTLRVIALTVSSNRKLLSAFCGMLSRMPASAKVSNWFRSVNDTSHTRVLNVEHLWTSPHRGGMTEPSRKFLTPAK